MNLEAIIIVVAGGLFGVLLGKMLDEAPNWVFYALLVVMLGLVLVVSLE